MHPLLLLSFATPLLAAAGDGDWATAYSKAATALAKLTNANKVALATGVGWQKGPCVGNVAAISSIGFPELCLQDSPLGYVCCFKFLDCEVLGLGRMKREEEAWE
jgi:beta-glucosidase